MILEFGASEASCSVSYQVIFSQFKATGVEIIGQLRKRCLEYLIKYVCVVFFRARQATNCTSI